MDFPENTMLPFFAYGIFKPGEIAFLRLKPFVTAIQPEGHCKGELLIRDGLLLLNPEKDDHVPGSLLQFTPELSGKAYYRILEIEPDKHYEWSTIDVQIPAKQEAVKANVLIGVNMPDGCNLLDRPFTSKNDPLFKEAFAIIDDTLAKSSERQDPDEPNPHFYNFLHLQMAYMLLWTSIERYVTLRYGLGEGVMSKIIQLRDDEYFCEMLKKHVNRRDQIFSTIDASKSAKLNKDNAKNSINFYYQVRCNITHRGKAAFEDFDRLRDSLYELGTVFKETLSNAFKKSEEVTMQ